MDLRQDPPGWNPPGHTQLCVCEHEKFLHGFGEHWTSCQHADCECSEFRVAYQSREVRAKFREEMDGGLRCRRCASLLHGAEYTAEGCPRCRPVSGEPVDYYASEWSEKVAGAWDEGFRAGEIYAGLFQAGDKEPPNPYRESD